MRVRELVDRLLQFDGDDIVYTVDDQGSYVIKEVAPHPIAGEHCLVLQ